MQKYLVLVFAAGFLFAGPAASQPPRLEHFQCYGIQKADPHPSAVVGLRDQFGAEEVEVVRAKHFCNPTRKIDANGSFPIEDVRQHLTFYSTYPQTSPLRWAVTGNQFGAQQVLVLREPVALAVPTHKPPHEAPKGLDHFRCYAAYGARVNKGVRLSDQFITPLTGHFVLNPVMFCNPTLKRHDDTVTEIQNPDEHLTCYSMTRAQFKTERDVRNQFGAQFFAIGAPDTLCVPSRKLAWGVIPDTPIGTQETANPAPVE